MGGLLALKSWNQFMDNPTGAYLGWIAGIYWLGNFISTPIAAWISNRWGRKPGVYAGYFFLIIGVGMQAGAQNEKTFTYYDHGGMVYWTMGAPIGETTIINRCRKEDSYESCRLKGTLPEAKECPAEWSL